MSMRTPPGYSDPEMQTAAQGVRALSSGRDERALAGTFNQNVTAGCRFKSRLKLQPIWSDGRYLVGWLSETEAVTLEHSRMGGR